MKLSRFVEIKSSTYVRCVICHILEKYSNYLKFSSNLINFEDKINNFLLLLLIKSHYHHYWLRIFYNFGKEGEEKKKFTKIQRVFSEKLFPDFYLIVIFLYIFLCFEVYKRFYNIEERMEEREYTKIFDMKSMNYEKHLFIHKNSFPSFAVFIQ